MLKRMPPGPKKFLKKLAWLLLVLFVLDFGIGKWMGHLYGKLIDNPVTYVLDTTKADVLVFGSSRAMRQYNPALLEKKFNGTVYNCGRHGFYMIYSLAAISTVMHRYHPKHIIIDLLPDEFGSSEENGLAMLLPYKDHPTIRPYIKYNSKFEELKLISQIYPYNSMSGKLLLSSIKPTQFDPQARTLGYAALNGVMADRPMERFLHKEIIPFRVALFDGFLNGLNKQNVKVTIVMSPMYFTYDPYNKTTTLLNGFSKKYKNISFINYQNNPLFFNSQLFWDDQHLNAKGAQVFSEDLVKRLKP